MTQTYAETALAPLAGRKVTPLSATLLRLAVVCIRWIEWNHSRKALRNMSDHILEDIGVTRHEAEREATRAYNIR